MLSSVGHEEETVGVTNVDSVSQTENASSILVARPKDFGVILFDRHAVKVTSGDRKAPQTPRVTCRICPWYVRSKTVPGL